MERGRNVGTSERRQVGTSEGQWTSDHGPADHGPSAISPKTISHETIPSSLLHIRPNPMPFLPLLPSAKHPCTAAGHLMSGLAGNSLARQHLPATNALDTKFGASIFSPRRCRAQLRVHGTRDIHS